MGRGIVESGLFRSERYGLEQRTSDPATTQEGEMWIRTDLAPDTDQLATLRFDAGASTWDVPIYDVAATTENVEKVWRVPIGGTTGFIPITDRLPTFSALKFQHNGASFGAHDALTASAIPDSGVARWTFDDADTSGSTAIDVWNGNDGTISGATTGVSGANQTYTTNEAYDLDGADDNVNAGVISVPWETAFSLSAWVNPDNTSGFNVIIGGDDASTERAFQFKIDSGNLKIVTPSGGTDLTGSAVSSSVWTHVVATFDGSTLELYQDGASDNSGSGSVNNADPPIFIGARSASAELFDGTIDDPRMYNKGLTSTEVSNLYNTGSISG